MSCPVCGASSSQKLLHRDTTPVYQNTVFKTPKAAAACATAQLHMQRCQNCGFIWNASFDPDAIGYDEDYENCQTHSRAFVEHLSTRTKEIFAALPDKSTLEIVEVGCGQGYFLDEIVARVPSDKTVHATGFDPAIRRDINEIPSNITLVGEYLSRQTLDRLELTPDIIISRHTIEHVADPVDFLRTIKGAIPKGQTTHLFLETPDSEWILQNGVFHDFFYEHCSLFNFRSMAEILHKTGFTPVRIESCFEGQYLWAHAVVSGTKNITMNEFERGSSTYITDWQKRIAQYKETGDVGIWGAGAKGATFALMVDEQRASIALLIDSNPDKAGGFLPLTAHPIVSPDDQRVADLATILIMNENYQTEIKQKINELGLNLQTVLVQ